MLTHNLAPERINSLAEPECAAINQLVVRISIFHPKGNWRSPQRNQFMGSFGNTWKHIWNFIFEKISCSIRKFNYVIVFLGGQCDCLQPYLTTLHSSQPQLQPFLASTAWVYHYIYQPSSLAIRCTYSKATPMNLFQLYAYRQARNACKR